MLAHESTAFLFFNLIVGTLLFADLALFHRRPRTMRVSEAIAWTCVWGALSLLFAAVLPWMSDNGIGVQGRHQHRVLFWGIVAAIGSRAVGFLSLPVITSRSFSIESMGA